MGGGHQEFQLPECQTVVCLDLRVSGFPHGFSCAGKL